MNNFFKLKYLLLFAFTAAVFSSCQNEPVTTEPQNTDSNLNVKKELDEHFKDYTLVELDTDALFNQMVSANGEIKTLKLDIPNIPIQDFELINDNDVFSDPSFDDQEFYYMKSTENKNPNDISWFSFYPDTPMYGNVIVREDDHNHSQKNATYVIEGVENYLNLNEDYDRKYKNLYVVYNYEDAIIKESSGCGVKERLTELPSDINSETFEKNTENRGPWIGVIPLHYYVGYHYIHTFTWGNKWHRARAEANDKVYGTRHYFLVEQRAGIDLRPSMEKGDFTWNDGHKDSSGMLHELRRHYRAHPPRNAGSKKIVSLFHHAKRAGAGMAWMPGICDEWRKFNVNKYHRNRLFFIRDVLAHEIGHNMGLDHISDQRNFMTAVGGSRGWLYEWQKRVMFNTHNRFCR